MAKMGFRHWRDKEGKGCEIMALETLIVFQSLSTKVAALSEVKLAEAIQKKGRVNKSRCASLPTSS
jgi:hypothetical protein